MVVSGGVPAMALAMVVVSAPLERMVSSIVVIVAMTALVSMVVVSVVLPISNAPDCSGIAIVEMSFVLSALVSIVVSYKVTSVVVAMAAPVSIVLSFVFVVTVLALLV